jgi:hypothetical protein
MNDFFKVQNLCFGEAIVITVLGSQKKHSYVIRYTFMSPVEFAPTIRFESRY